MAKDESKQRRVYAAPTLVVRRLEEVVRGEEGSGVDAYGEGAMRP